MEVLHFHDRNRGRDRVSDILFNSSILLLLRRYRDRKRDLYITVYLKRILKLFKIKILLLQPTLRARFIYEYSFSNIQKVKY